MILIRGNMIPLTLRLLVSTIISFLLFYILVELYGNNFVNIGAAVISTSIVVSIWANIVVLLILDHIDNK